MCPIQWDRVQLNSIVYGSTTLPNRGGLEPVPQRGNAEHFIPWGLNILNWTWFFSRRGPPRGSYKLVPVDCSLVRLHNTQKLKTPCKSCRMITLCSSTAGNRSDRQRARELTPAPPPCQLVARPYLSGPVLACARPGRTYSCCAWSARGCPRAAPAGRARRRAARRPRT